MDTLNHVRNYDPSSTLMQPNKARVQSGCQLHPPLCMYTQHMPPAKNLALVSVISKALIRILYLVNASKPATFRKHFEKVIPMTPLTWICKPFDELTPRELYAAMQLRIEVFVLEQNAPFQDADNKDQPSHHLLGFDGDTLLLYARIVPAGVSYPEHVSIGRIITAPEVRGKGLGKVLVQKSIDECYRIFGEQTIKIGAQARLEKFYTDFGFVTTSDVYIEDGIDHVEMTRIA